MGPKINPNGCCGCAFMIGMYLGVILFALTAVIFV